MRLLAIALSFCLLASIVAPSCSAASDDALSVRLKHDQFEFSASVQKAFNRLLDDYQAVIKIYLKDNDLDNAVAVGKARDGFAKLAQHPIAGIPLVENGWTILLRSSNPLLWNIDCANADSYSMQVAKAPKDCKYLRMRRMDTKDFVIMPITHDDLSGNSMHTLVWFRGDERINRNACNLGIVDQHRKVADPEPFMAAEGDGHHSGWGFGESGSDEIQTRQWDGKEIGNTAIEIAVTARELEPLEQEKLQKTAP